MLTSSVSVPRQSAIFPAVWRFVMTLGFALFGGVFCSPGGWRHGGSRLVSYRITVARAITRKTTLETDIISMRNHIHDNSSHLCPRCSIAHHLFSSSATLHELLENRGFFASLSFNCMPLGLLRFCSHKHFLFVFSSSSFTLSFYGPPKERK